MKVDAIRLDLRPRAMFEAADLGVRLVSAHLRAVWSSCAPVYVFVLLVAGAAFAFGIGWGVPHADLAQALARSLDPVRARARRRSAKRPRFADLWRRAPRRLRRRPARRADDAAPLALALVRAAGAAARGPARQGAARAHRPHPRLASRRGARDAERVRAFESALAFGLASLIPWFAPADERGAWLGRAVRRRLGPGRSRIELACFALAVAIVEPFFVGAGFAMYLNRRVELEAWDIEQEFRACLRALTLAPARARCAAMAGGALSAGRSARLAGSRWSPRRSRCRRRVLAAEADAPTGHGERAWKRARAERAHAPHRRAPAALSVAAVEAAASAVRADDDLGGLHKQRTWRFRDRNETSKPPAPAPQWLRELARWLAEGGRWLIWLLVALRRWQRCSSPRGAGSRCAATAVGARGARLPSHVRELDIRPESLPADIGAAVRALWLAGERRAALSLLYRGALSRLVHSYAVPIGDASTEGDCVQPRACRAAGAAQRVRRARSSTPGSSPCTATGRSPPSTCCALCADFDRLLPAQRRERAGRGRGAMTRTGWFVAALVRRSRPRSSPGSCRRSSGSTSTCRSCPAPRGRARPLLCRQGAGAQARRRGDDRAQLRAAAAAGRDAACSARAAGTCSRAARPALRRWVEAGGHLVVLQSAWSAQGDTPDWVPMRSRRLPRPPGAASAAAAASATEADAEAETSNQVIAEMLPRPFGRCAEYAEPARIAGAFGAPRALSDLRQPEPRCCAPTRRSWLLAGDDGVVAARVPYGRGDITASALEGSLSNGALLRDDGALAFAALLAAAARATRCGSSTRKRARASSRCCGRTARRRSCSARAAHRARCSGAAAPRFGPLLADAPRARRSIGEQVRRTAAFIAAGGGAALHRASVRALEEQARRSIAGYGALLGAARAQRRDRRSAAASTPPRSPRALQPPERADRHRLAAAIARLEHARRALEPARRRAVAALPTPPPPSPP